MTVEMNRLMRERADALAEAERLESQLARHKQALADLRELHEPIEYPLDDPAFGARLGFECSACGPVPRGVTDCDSLRPFAGLAS